MTSTNHSSSQTLNRDSITALVHAFYRDVQADGALGPVFNQAISDWPSHLDRMVDFWSTVMLGGRSFRGNVYGKHMALQGVEGEQFDRWMHLWERHTNRLFIPEVAEEFQRVAAGIGRMLRHGLLGDPLPRAIGN